MGEGGITKLILDALVLVMLAVTVFYAGRLSLHLKNFRDSRKSLEGLLERLSDNIDRAERAIAGMREVARDSGAALHEKIKDAQALADELQVMQEAGNNLAGRLEKLADRNSSSNNDFSIDRSTLIRAGEAKGFAIRDTEFERDDLDDDSELTGFSDDSASSNFASRAEQELFEALQRGGRKPKGGKGLL